MINSNQTNNAISGTLSPSVQFDLDKIKGKPRMKNNGITPEKIQADVNGNLAQLQRQAEGKKGMQVSIPPFPVDAFPKPVQHVISEFNRAYQLPVDYYGLGILTVCASVIGNAYTLQYKMGYSVSPIIYGAIVGGSSIGKTPALKLCLSPIFSIEESYHTGFSDAMKEWEIAKDVPNGENGLPPKPERKDLLINDATTEAINRVLERNPKGLILFQDELMAWINSLNQYRKGSDTEFWLSNWSNSPAKINRATKDPIFIKRPFVGVIGGIQPSILDGLGEGNKKDNGFLFRILFAYPDEQKKPYETGYTPHMETFEAYKDLVTKIHHLPNRIEQNGLDTKIESIPLELDNKARSLFQKWNRKNTDVINNSTNDSVKSLFGKLENYALRFALTLEIMERVSNNETIEESKTVIRLQTMHNALRLVEYFRATGLKVLNRIEKTNPLEEFSKVEQQVYEALPATFKTNEGVLVAIEYGMPERTFKRFIKNKFLFEKISRGVYDKSL